MYLGYSLDNEIRFRASSGGVGSSILKYLFENHLILNSISFYFDKNTLEYKPKIIHSFEDYQITGSIYQEINIINFISNNISQFLEGNTALFCLPCQTLAIRNIFKKINKDIIIIGLTCSSQQHLEATKFLLRKINLRINDIRDLRYRGNGWPSGIQIKTSTEQSILIPNSNSIWSQIFHSRLFVMKRCLYCQNTLNKDADIVLADPWLYEIMKVEKIGKTLFKAYTNQGIDILNECISMNYILADELDDSLFVFSQNKTILRKKTYKIFPILRSSIKGLSNNRLYLKLVENKFFFMMHCYILKKIENYFIGKLK